MAVVGFAVGDLYELVSRFYYLDEISKRDTVVYGSGHVEDTLDRW